MDPEQNASADPGLSLRDEREPSAQATGEVICLHVLVQSTRLCDMSNWDTWWQRTSECSIDRTIDRSMVSAPVAGGCVDSPRAQRSNDSGGPGRVTPSRKEGVAPISCVPAAASWNLRKSCTQWPCAYVPTLPSVSHNRVLMRSPWSFLAVPSITLQSINYRSWARTHSSHISVPRPPSISIPAHSPPSAPTHLMAPVYQYFQLRGNMIVSRWSDFALLRWFLLLGHALSDTTRASERSGLSPVSRAKLIWAALCPCVCIINAVLGSSSKPCLSLSPLQEFQIFIVYYLRI